MLTFCQHLNFPVESQPSLTKVKLVEFHFLSIMDLGDQNLLALKHSRQESIQVFFKTKFFWLRMINKYGKNFVQFNNSWKEIIEKNTMEKISQLAEAVKSFFEAFPYYEETQIQMAPLHVAAWKGNLDLCKNIIKKTSVTNPHVAIGTGTNDGRMDGWTPLHMAAANGHFEVVRLIIALLKDKNPKVSTSSGKTPLHLAADNGYLNISILIIENVDEKNPEDSAGNTPLHFAASRGYFWLCKFILGNIKNDQDKHTTNQSGLTPQNLADMKGHKQVSKLF